MQIFANIKSKTMTESSAASKADTILLAILTNNPNCLGSGNMTDSSNAAEIAKSLATFRETLIASLKKQPD